MTRPTILVQVLLAPILAAGLFASAPALAERAATPEERAQIEAVLKREGFVRWDEIEFDDRHFEVEDAVAADGRKFDLEIDPQSYAILRRDPD